MSQAAEEPKRRIRGAMAHGWMGCACFAGCAAAMVLVWLVTMNLLAEPRLAEMFRSKRLMFHFWRSLYTGIPCTGLMGFVAGLVFFQGGVDDALETVFPVLKRTWRIPWWVGMVVFSLCVYPLIPFMLLILIQSAVRSKTVEHSKGSSMQTAWYLIFIVTVYLGGALVMAHLLFHQRASYADNLSAT